MAPFRYGQRPKFRLKTRNPKSRSPSVENEPKVFDFESAPSGLNSSDRCAGAELRFNSLAKSGIDALLQPVARQKEQSSRRDSHGAQNDEPPPTARSSSLLGLSGHEASPLEKSGLIGDALRVEAGDSALRRIGQQ